MSCDLVCCAEKYAKIKRKKNENCLPSQLYRGYVDDPRNTDNAWMETVASHFYDKKGDQVPTLAGAPHLVSSQPNQTKHFL